MKMRDHLHLSHANEPHTMPWGCSCFCSGRAFEAIMGCLLVLAVAFRYLSWIALLYCWLADISWFIYSSLANSCKYCRSTNLLLLDRRNILQCGHFVTIIDGCANNDLPVFLLFEKPFLCLRRILFEILFLSRIIRGNCQRWMKSVIYFSFAH